MGAEKGKDNCFKERCTIFVYVVVEVQCMYVCVFRRFKKVF